MECCFADQPLNFKAMTEGWNKGFGILATQKKIMGVHHGAKPSCRNMSRGEGGNSRVIAAYWLTYPGTFRFEIIFEKVGSL